MSLLEEENIHLRARVSELEGNSNVFPTNVTQKRSSGTPLSPMSHTQPSNDETHALDTQVFSPNLTKEVYAQ
uniref:Uncharacterized protein n=1 Tax=Brassica campestris TaxID=3711 RepID=A0A3P5YWA4_BRACM|nr:unnamed protein product [Brassica rapa]